MSKIECWHCGGTGKLVIAGLVEADDFEITCTLCYGRGVISK